MKKEEDFLTLDLGYMLRSLLNKAWAIILAVIIGGGLGYCAAELAVSSEYESSALIYVSSNAEQDENKDSIGASELSAAQSLIKTCGAMLNSRSLLQDIIDTLSLGCDIETLSAGISCEAELNSEIMRVTVVWGNPDIAAEIAAYTSTALTDKVRETVKGCSFTVIDPAMPNYEPVSPDVLKYAFSGALFGLLISCCVVYYQAETLKASKKKRHTGNIALKYAERSKSEK